MFQLHVVKGTHQVCIFSGAEAGHEFSASAHAEDWGFTTFAPRLTVFSSNSGFVDLSSNTLKIQVFIFLNSIQVQPEVGCPPLCMLLKLRLCRV